jgi:diacylglycerol kinase (ATP)
VLDHGIAVQRARLIVNPGAGTDRAASLLPLINERLRAFVDTLDITLTTSAGDAELTAARAAHEQCDAVFVAGGDGTINRVLRGLRTSAVPGARIPIGIVPVGTGNDFVKALGLPEDPEAALEALVQCRVLEVDVGLVNDLPFVNASAGGFVADVSDAVTDDLKDVAGKLAYLIGGARALMDSEPFTTRITPADGAHAIPGAPSEPGRVRMFAICNGPFIGGGRAIAPDARLDNGLLDVLVVPHLPTVEFLRVLQRIGAGDRNGHPDLRHFRTSALDMTFDRVVRINTDGEVLTARAAQYRTDPRAARFFCGESPRANGAPRILERDEH